MLLNPPPNPRVTTCNLFAASLARIATRAQVPSIAIAACLLLGSHLSYGESAADGKPVAAKVTFDEHVKPIFRQHCASCHHQGDKKGGLALDTFTSLIEGGASGEVVYDDGDYESSRLWQLVTHEDTPEMPPNQDKLPADQLETIRKWLEGGALENNGSKAKKKKKNSLAFVASSAGKPENGGVMPDVLPQGTPVVTSRAAAITAIATSPWAPLVAIAGQKQIVMYHTENDELLGILPFPEGIAQSLRFSRNGAFLIAGGGEHSISGIVAVYDVKTGKRVAQVGDELDTLFDSDANATMSRIACGGPLKMLRIYDATDGTKLFDIKKHTDWILSVAYSPDGVLIASGDRSGGLCVWEAETGRQYLDLTVHKGAIHAVSWRDDSNVLASASADGTVKLWDMNQGKAIKSINVKGGAVFDVSFDHQARLVTASADNKAKLWDANGNHVRDFQALPEDVLEVEITHDGKRIFYGDWSGQVLSSLTADPAKKQSLAANPPPPKDRLEGIQKRIAATQSELKPLAEQLTKANAALKQTQVAKSGLQAQIAAMQKKAVDQENQAKQSVENLATIDQAIAAMTNQSRDLQDSLTAIRVQSKSDAAKSKQPAVLEQIAKTEQAFANHLLALVEKRRERIQVEKQIASFRAAAVAKNEEAKKLAAGMPPIDKKLAAETQVVKQVQTSHALVQLRLVSVQKRRDAIQAEIQ